MKNWFNKPKLSTENERLKVRVTLLENELDILVNKISGLADTARYVKEDIDNPLDMPNTSGYPITPPGDE
jgi:hypothetical protein